MIRERLLALRERRAILIARAEHQRNGLAELVVRAETATMWLERGRALYRRLSAHPLWVAAGVALVVALRPRRSLSLIATALSLWRGWRSLRASLLQIMPRPKSARSEY
jgi:hypothetical protein